MPGCSEQLLVSLAEDIADELNPGDRVILEGPMGAGKTTFARALLHGLGVRQPPEGSPSFAIAHEYSSAKGPVVHVDFYRIRNAIEIEEAGIEAYYWESPKLVISEWLSLWPELERSVRQGGHGMTIRLSFNREGDVARRDVEIERF